MRYPASLVNLPIYKAQQKHRQDKIDDVDKPDAVKEQYAVWHLSCKNATIILKPVVPNISIN